MTVSSALKCDTNTGPVGSATVKITAAGATGSNIITASLPTLPAGITATLTAGAAALNSSTAFATWTVTPTAGCAGTTMGAYAPVLQFQSAVASGSASNDITVTLAETVSTTGTTSPLVASPTSLTIACTKDAFGNFTGGSTTFNVTSTATGGNTPVTVASASIPAWLSITPPNPAKAGTSPITFTASVANSSCSGAVGSSKSATLQLANAPATAVKTLPVTLEVVGPSQLTLSPTSDGVSSTPAVLSYVKNQSGASSTTVTVKGANLYFVVDTTTLPSWLTVNFTSGLATSGGYALIFTVTKVADALTPGTYPSAGNPAAISLQVAGYANTYIYVSLAVTNTAPTLSVAEGMARNLTWSSGPLPTATITAVSSGSPIPFTVSLTNPSTNGANPSTSISSGLAYSFGTAIDVTFDPLAFAGAQPGSTLSGTVTLNWSGTAIPVVFNISIQAPSQRATLSGITPTNLPTAPAGQTFSVILYGSGFVSSTDPTQATTVGIVSGGALHVDPNIAVTVQNGSTIALVITVPAASPADTYLPFGTANSQVVIGVCNPAGSTCTTATGTMTLTIAAGPTIQAGGVTSASTFAAVVPPNGTLAPYDIISIFGSNFCVSNGTGCTNGAVLYAPLTASLVYGTSLTPDAGQRNLQVFFYPTGTTSGTAAPLLFATNSQINLVVPSGLTVTNKYDIVVKFGTLTSAAYTFTVANDDPGIFPIDTNSPAQGAVTIPSGPVADNSNAARLRANSTDSDIVSVFMTGLGIPTSTGANTASGSSTPPTDCVSVANYKTSAGLTSLDGAVIQSALIAPTRFVPCFDQTSYLTATVAQATATPTFVGWAPDSIAGLYQVNLQLPSKGSTLKDITGTTIDSFTGPTQVLVQLTMAGDAKTSQSTIAMYVQPAQTFKAAGTPSVATLTNGVYQFTVSSLSGAGSTAVALDQVSATGGSGPTYAVTAVSGSDTNGAAATGDFAVDSSGNITISRAYLAGTYSVTITATDNSSPTAYPTETVRLIFTVS